MLHRLLLSLFNHRTPEILFRREKSVGFPHASAFWTYFICPFLYIVVLEKGQAPPSGDF